MKTIMELLTEAGVAPVAATGIMEALAKYKTKVEAEAVNNAKAVYESKLDKAKKACVEEIKKHEEELARRVQIFLEAKTRAIETSVSKTTALAESESQGKLKTLKAILENVKLPDSKETSDSAGKIEDLQAQVKQLTEQRNTAVASANRHIALARKLQESNRKLVESKAEPKKPKTQRLDEGRTSVTPVTTRPQTKLVEQKAPVPTSNKLHNVTPAQIAGMIS